MREITIESKKFGSHILMVDDEDYEKLSPYKWRLCKSSNTYYSVRRSRISDGGKDRAIVMHRVIMGLEYGDKKIVDHIDHNGLNNQKNNLRICTNMENSRNTRVDNKNTLNSSSKYKGVGWNKHHSKWQAYICVAGKIVHLGYFISELPAAMAYDLAALKYFEDFSALNFTDAENRVEEFEVEIKKDRDIVTFQTSKYFGVSKSGNRWRAKHKGIHIGYFRTEIAAHEAYLNFVKGLK